MKRLILLLTAFLFSSCATPPKPVRYDYIPPASEAGLACIQRCAVQNNTCRQRITQQHNQCRAQARQQAKIEMPGRVKAYENAINAWERAVRRYERDLSFYEMERRHERMMRSLHRSRCRGKDKKKHRDCRPYYAPHWESRFWRDEPRYPGRAPRRPTLERVTEEIISTQCQKSNQCKVEYRQCYVQCGGTVKVVK